MMNRIMFASLPFAALLAGGATALSAEDAGVSAAPPEGDFSPIQRYAIAYDKPRDLAEFYLNDFGIKPRHADFQLLDHPSDPTMRVMLVTVEGIQSASVQGVQWRIGMRADAGRWEAVEAGIRRKCRAGAADEWTREVCP